MNASALGYGLTVGGAECVREELENFSKTISEKDAKKPLQLSMIYKIIARTVSITVRRSCSSTFSFGSTQP